MDTPKRPAEPCIPMTDAPKRRGIRNQRRALISVNDVGKSLLNRKGPKTAGMLLDALIEHATDRVTRFLEDLELTRERTVVLQKEFLSTIAQALNSRMFVLSVVAVVFLPSIFATGLLGMNVGALPGLDNFMGFWWSVLILPGAEMALYFFYKKKKWV